MPNEFAKYKVSEVPSKIFCRILIDRVKIAVDVRLRQEQAGFRQGRGTMEQIFTLGMAGPHLCELRRLQESINSVIKEKLWIIMQEYGTTSIYINIIRDLYDQSSSCILEGRGTSDWFEVRSGVKQGCVMSGFILIGSIGFLFLCQ